MSFIHKFYTKLHNKVSLSAMLGFVFGATMSIVWAFIPFAGYSWITKEMANKIVIAGLIVAGICFVVAIWGVIKTPVSKAYPSFSLILGIRNRLWRLYKMEQEVVLLTGFKGLEKDKLEEVRTKARNRYKLQPFVVNKTFSEEEIEQHLLSINKRLKLKRHVDNKMLKLLWGLGNTLDSCRVGLYSLMNGYKEYESLTNKLGENRSVSNANNKIKRIRELSYGLNSSLLSLLYLDPIIKQSKYYIPLDMLKDSLDEEMFRSLERIK